MKVLSALRNSKTVWPKGTLVTFRNSCWFNYVWFEGKLAVKEWLNNDEIFPLKVSWQYVLIPVLKKKKRPSYLIIHVGTNNATSYTSTEVLDKLLKQKQTLCMSHINTAKIIYLHQLLSKSSIGCSMFTRTITSISKYSSSTIAILCRTTQELKGFTSIKRLLVG